MQFWFRIVLFLSVLHEVLSQCIRLVKRDSFNQIVVYRKFANGSIAILDDFGKYGVFSSSGTQQYLENLNLPVHATIGQRAKVYIATINSA